MKSKLLLLPLALSAGAANASSDAAWAKLNLSVAEKCAKASGLNHAHVSRIVYFDDTLGKVATLVTGISAQRSQRGAQARMLCVYDKRTGRTWVDEAKGWTAPDLE